MKLVSVLHRKDKTENRKIFDELKNVSVIPDRSQQKNRELRRAAQSCSKFTDTFKKSRRDDQSSTNESLDDVTDTNMQEDSGEQKWNYVFFLIFISFLALLTFSFMKHIDPFPLHLITKQNKISRVKLLLRHTYYV